MKSARFILAGLRAVLKGRLEVSVLDAAAIAAAMLTGDYDTASSVMFLLDTGGLLEEWTHRKSVGDLARAMSLGVDKVWILTGAREVLVPVSEVAVGDIAVVRTSNVIPLDGRVISGEAAVNQSSMTGESVPVVKGAGGYVYAGTVVEEGLLQTEVASTSGSGKYDQIVRMIEESEKLKSETETRAFRMADRLVPLSLAGTALTWLITRNVARAISFLMVDYSCAMKLSMPLSVLSAIREAGEYDISVRGGKFLEAVAGAETIVFDKTGTLTHARPRLAGVIPFNGADEKECLRIAACLEEHYPHSMANAVVEGAKERGLDHEEMHTEVDYVVAHGIASRIEGERVIIGSRHFVFEDEHCLVGEDELDKLARLPEEFSHLYLAAGGRLMAVLLVADPLREDAACVVDELHRLGLKRIVMMTGDNEKTAAGVARKLALDEYRAEVLSGDKADFIRREHEAGRRVIMVGDGVNDTPALSEADCGVAISDGAAIAREVADVVIRADSLDRIVVLRRIAMLLMGRIRRNYRFIVGFNSALIGLGVAGVLPPAGSALLHNGSTIAAGVGSVSNLLPDKEAGRSAADKLR